MFFPVSYMQYLSCLSTSSSNDKLAFDVGLQETAEGMVFFFFFFFFTPCIDFFDIFIIDSFCSIWVRKESMLELPV